jgi:hypothetical protein
MNWWKAIFKKDAMKRLELKSRNTLKRGKQGITSIMSFVYQKDRAKART